MSHHNFVDHQVDKCFFAAFSGIYYHQVYFPIVWSEPMYSSLSDT